MELKQQLVSLKPRETSGSRASQGFSYQRIWALCLLLDIHTSRDDYAVLFDYFDDVVVLDSATEPKTIEFYQIKKRRDGLVNLNDLTHRVKKKGETGSMSLSVIGKMVSNYLKFPAHTSSLNHVTNVRYKMIMADGRPCPDKVKICLNELDVEAVHKIKLQMMEEHHLETPPEIESITFFIVSSLSPDDAETHARGKLSDFLERELPGKPMYVGPLYKCLATEIERRNNKITDTTNFDDLVKQKSLTKANMTDLMVKLPIKVDVDGLLAHKWTLLSQEGMTYTEIEGLQSAIKRYELKRTNKADTVLSQAAEAVKEALRQVKTKASYRTLKEKIMQTAELAEKDISIKADVLNRTYLEGIVLYHEVCDE
ncbi:MAG: DUF4297 domain-containing protein [Syntrophales bacterium]